MMTNLSLCKNKLALFIASTLLSSPAWAGTITGPEEDTTVGSGALPENWQVRDGATLTLASGAGATAVNAQNGSSVFANNAALHDTPSSTGSYTLSLTDSQATLINTSVRTDMAGKSGSLLVIGDTAKLTMQGGEIYAASSRALQVTRGTVDLTDVTVRADLNGAVRSITDGKGINLVRATLTASGGEISGATGSILIIGDRNAATDLSTVNLDGTSLHSGTGPIFLVTSPVPAYRGAVADIHLANISNASAGNGNLLEADSSHTDLALDNSVINGNIVIDSTATAAVTLENGSRFSGSTANAGALSMNVDDSSVWDVTGNSTLSSLNNAGTVQFSNGSVGRTLTVSGDYTGSNGLMVFNSALDGDNSPTDRLIVEGNTAGNTRVSVNNLGGSGADTVNGIELIRVGGLSDGEFTQQGRIVAGAYDYRLVRGQGANAANWYLSSELVDTGNPGPGDPGTGEPGTGEPGTGEPGTGEPGTGEPGTGEPGTGEPGTGEPGTGEPGTGEPGTGEPGEGITPPGRILTLRPEGGAYASNLAATRSLFDVRLADRQGETVYTDAATGEQRVTSLWMKNTGSHTRSHDESGQLKSQANDYVLMLGGDIANGEFFDGGRWRFGAMAGYGNSSSNTHSTLTGYRAKGQVDGYSTGVYGTWYASGSRLQGLYVDSTLQYSWFNNSVSGEDESAEKYNANGFQSSLETGYVMKFGDATPLYLQPAIQTQWSGVRSDSHTEANGTRIGWGSSDNVRTRAGIKAFTEVSRSAGTAGGPSFLPFVEANWIHNTGNNTVSMDEVNVSQAGTRNLAEVSAGIEGRLTSRLNVNGSITQQTGSQSYSNTGASVGLRYSF